MSNSDAFDRSNEVAVVGMVCRLPGARNIDEFWQNLRAGIESISFFTDEELLAAGVDPSVASTRSYVKAGAILEDIEWFDASFFGFTPREAEITDPQHRIFLECAWEALENAGYHPDNYRGRIGVYAGVGMNTYVSSSLYMQSDSSADLFQVAIGNEKDHLATHTSYKLNLKGPSVSVSTACSTSLVAIHLACQSLLNGECDMFLAGGVSVRTPQKVGYSYQVEGIVSPDGHCRAFDAKAQGTVPGNGVGIVVLKRLTDALADGDCIHAVIKGSAINNDGSLKIGYTAPSVQGQAEVIAEAQAVAGIEPETITYIEAHGTGTPLGDPIEIAALTKVFRARTRKKGFCAIGSVKTNIGHLDAATGVTGFIKTVLALKHHLIPPSLHFEQPNPEIDFANSPFYVNRALAEWKAGSAPRRAGVSSFGLGGTNVHLLLEEAPAVERIEESRPWQMLILSAQTDSALHSMSLNLAEHLKRRPHLSLADVAYTLQVGRKAFGYRQVVVCHDLNDAVHTLEALDPARVFRAFQETTGRSIAFLFPGLGDHYVHMAWGLYQAMPLFRAQVDHCCELLKPHLGLDLRDVMYAGNWRTSEAPQDSGEDLLSPSQKLDLRKMLRREQKAPDESTALLNETWLAQPAVFVIEYALARLWIEWIGYPRAMVGYSLGEYVAACLAGVISLEDALLLVAKRAQMIHELPAGAMLAIPFPESEAQMLAGKGLYIAAVNTPSLCVVSGPIHAIDELEEELTKIGVTCRRLQTSHAFHSQMMAPIVDAFVELLGTVKLRSPKIPYLSNVTGTWITPTEAMEPGYWVRHMCQGVRFADGIRELFEASNHILLEVGPGQALSTLAMQNLETGRLTEQTIVPSLRYTFDRQADMAFLLNTLGRLWLAGIQIDWSRFYAGKRRLHIPLPTYPFERQRYWLETQRQALSYPTDKKPWAKRPNIADWFYLPSWKHSLLHPPLSGLTDQKQRWLVFIDEWGIGRQIVKRLEQENQEVVTVVTGNTFNRLADKSYTLNPRERSGYDALLKELQTRKNSPGMIVHCWSISAPKLNTRTNGETFKAQTDIEAFKEAQHMGFYSLLFLTQSLGKHNVTDPLQIRVVANYMHDLESGDALDPRKATLLGPCKVIPQEYTNIACQSIDIALPEAGSQEECKLLDQLMAELHEPLLDPVIAYRGAHRWVQTFEALALEDRAGQPTRLREKGVYLVTGGLGKIGFYLARWLARSRQARLVLIGRSELPPREEWQHWLASHDRHDGISARIRRVQELEELGAEVLVMSADATHVAQMQAVITRAIERFGKIDGVIHAAGLVDEKYFLSIQELGYDDCEVHFQPKVYATLVLEEVLRTCKIDFCLVLSSLSSVLGGLQFTAYTAANVFLDAYTHKHNRTHLAPWISVDWDGFATPGETVDAMQRILSLGSTQQVVVSTGDLHARLEQWITPASLREGERERKPAHDQAASFHHPRPNLQNAYVAPRNELEQAIVDTWQAMLGIEQIGIHDNFFTLGGHSLLATQITTRLRKIFQVALPLRTFLETPTVAELAVTVAHIQAQRGAQPTTTPPLVSAARTQDLPLSFAQQRLWFLDQLEPGNAAYNILVVVQLSGILNVQALEGSLEGVAQRHEILRTTFRLKDGQPVQIIGSADRVRVPLVDLSRLSRERREAQRRWLEQQQAQLPFDLTRGPLLRTILLHLGEKEHIMLLLMHHIVTDGWSNGILLHELGRLYNACVAGQPSPLPELAVQYADFAAWQRQWLQGEMLQTQLDYWTHWLRGAMPLKLPTDRLRPAIQTYHGAHRFFYLPASLSNELQELSQRERVTLFMLLLAAFQLLLAHYSGQSDISVGTSIANRTQSEFEGLIGFFVNTLVLRSDLSGNPTFRQVLARVQEVCLDAYAHQDVPFEKLVEALQPERDLSRTPLFQVMFVLQNAPRPLERLQGLTLSGMPSESAMTKFDLTLSITEMEQGLHCEVEYNTDLFEASTISRLAGHFQTLLEGIVAHPERHVAELPLLSAAERRQLLVEWNNTAVFYSQGKGLHQIFEGQVARSPQAVALVFQDDQVTYAELDRRATRLAQHLQSLGIGPDALVGICMERCLELVIGLFGILKAGGAYVPLDPGYPRERLAFMLADSQVGVLLTQQSLLNVLPVHQAQVFCLDAGWDKQVCMEQVEDELPRNELAPEHLAYMIYTSGSTGRPKGAMNTHRAICNRLLWMQEAYQLTPADRVLQKTPFSFDVSVWEFFWPLLNGACLVVAAPGGHRESGYLVRLISAQAISTLHFVPSMLQIFLQEPGLEICSSLRHVICSGEALSSDLQERFFARLQASLLNLYGPTEAAVDVTAWTCEPGSARRTIPIGRPIANIHIYVLDRHLYPVPIGAAGELHIGGTGISRGYWGCPDLTAEKFIPDPLSDEAGARLYRTGDLARYRADGAIEYLGRLDQQVKLRGYRIELEEIEAVLAEHPGVLESVVVLRQDEQEEQRVVAYVVPTGSAPVSSSVLRQYLWGKLPDYMVPSFFVCLEALPLMANGKLDRRALPALDMSAGERSESLMGPRGPLEELVTEVWSEVLKPVRASGMRTPGRHENFFELGGHSLLATKLITRLREIVQVQVPLRSLFEAPTVAGLAERVERALHSEQSVEAPPLAAVSRAEDLALSFAQQRLWFLDQLEPGSAAYNIPMAIRLSGVLETRVLEHSVEEIMRRHEILHTTFQARGDQPVQVIEPVRAFLLPLADLSGLSPEQGEMEVRRLVRQEMQRPFDLARGPLLRATLVRLNRDEHALLLNMHHIVSDGWSSEIFLHELSILYNACCAGLPSPLPDLPIQYADFARWQRQWLQGEKLEKQVRYWTQQLSGITSLDLPTDYSRPAAQTFHGAHQYSSLPAALGENLKRLSQREGVTLFMTLVAAFQALLARYSGQTDISVGTPIANRTRGEIEGLIGFFVNTLVLRSDLSGNPTFQQALTRVREVCLGAYTHQDVPFEKLVEALQPERDLSRSPFFQTMLILQNAPPASEELMGVITQPLEEAGTTAKFDLTLYVIDTRQELRCVLEYNTDLFKASTIARLLEHWQTLLEGIVASPEQRMADLPLLTQDERHQLLIGWNDARLSYPDEQCIHQIIEAQVMRTPEAIAVSCDGEHVTYQQLNAQANWIANILVEHGIGPEIPVALLAERSLSFVTILLAIFKAGGVYLPLDPLYPAHRLCQMLKPSGCPLVITSSMCMPTLLQAVMEMEERPTILQLETLLTRQRVTTNLPARCGPRNLAYVIYTSGSTGAPKGVMVEYGGMLNHVYAKIADVQLSHADSVAQNGPQCFDISVWQCLAALVIGGRVEVLPDEIALEPARLLSEVEERAITILQLVPSMLSELIAEVESLGDRSPGLRTLRWVVPTGDALPAELCRRWLNLYPAIPLLNTYGSTECSDDQCHYPIDRTLSAENWTPIMPVGLPIGNMRAYVLDRMLAPVPVGVIGELYIGGLGVGRGYLKDPERTAQVFLPDPFSQAAGARLYKTGDVARRLPDGPIEFLGRVDQLVKVRGYRIELGEVEDALAQCPEVGECAVVAYGEAGRDKRLAAYVVSRQQPARSAGDLRNYLQRKLPDYMLPSHFVFLDALPLTPNGKVDRKALPPPHLTEADFNDNFVAPRNPVEELLAATWCEILGLQRIGIHDNFFAAGGHSLLATQVISRIRSAFQIALPLRAIFEAPTIAELAERVAAALGLRPELQAPPIVPISRKQDLPLSFAQQRLWFLEQVAPNNPAYVIAVALNMQGRLDIAALERGLQQIVQRHESLRTTFVARAGHPLQVISADLHMELKIVDLHMLTPVEQTADVPRLLGEEARHPFNLSRLPLLRAGLLRLGEQEHIFFLLMHHIISDVWSLSVFLRELSTLYAASSQGKPSPLPPLPIQYADFALWQREWLQGRVLDAQVAYWTKQLSGASALELPTDRQRPGIPGYQGAGYSFTLSDQLSRDLLILSRQEGSTLFMTLLAAFQTLLYRYTGQQDIVVGTDIANRTHTETEGLIGFFVNLLALRTGLDGQLSFRQILRRVRAMVLDAYAYQDLPFEKLIDALQLERTVYEVPLVRVLFVFQNIPLPPLSMQGVTVRPLEIEMHTAKFDLAVFLWEETRGLAGVVNYRTDLFDSGTIAKIVEHFGILLHSIITLPDAPAEALEMYSEAEKAECSSKEAVYHETHRRELKAAKRNIIALPGSNF